jgi:GNAT superfamily N-acetyltransferase
MIRFISGADVLPVRNEMLREGRLSPEECVFSGDADEGSFHLGYVHEDQLVSIATFHRQPGAVVLPVMEGRTGYQLRGMATLTRYQGKGFGNRLVNFAIVYLKGQKVNYLWCNARKKAFSFYQGLGFEFISGEFDVPGIGPHKVMYLKIQ